MIATATVDSDAGTFTITKGVWSGTFPLAELSRWVAFYRRQQELFPDRAVYYDDDIRALNDLSCNQLT